MLVIVINVHFFDKTNSYNSSMQPYLLLLLFIFIPFIYLFVYLVFDGGPSTSHHRDLSKDLLCKSPNRFLLNYLFFIF